MEMQAESHNKSSDNIKWSCFDVAGGCFEITVTIAGQVPNFPQHESAIFMAAQILLNAAVQLQCAEHHKTLYLVMRLCMTELPTQSLACRNCAICQQLPGLSYRVDKDSISITWHLW